MDKNNIICFIKALIINAQFIVNITNEANERCKKYEQEYNKIKNEQLSEKYQTLLTNYEKVKNELTKEKQRNGKLKQTINNIYSVLNNSINKIKEFKPQTEEKQEE